MNLLNSSFSSKINTLLAYLCLPFHYILFIISELGAPLRLLYSTLGDDTVLCFKSLFVI